MDVGSCKKNPSLKTYQCFPPILIGRDQNREQVVFDLRNLALHGQISVITALLDLTLAVPVDREITFYYFYML
jgi:hypothetical protein